MRRVFLTLFAAFFFVSPCEAGPFDLIAREGMRGDDISHIQLLLSHLGIYKGPLDSRFGPETRLAVVSFQKWAGLPEDGVITKLVMEQIVKRARRVINNPPGRYARVLNMEATAYTSEDPGCGLYTAGGNRLRRGIVAVDPRVIPLGTRLFVSGYGHAVADDTGGAIKGNRIDLAYESRPDALKFGRRMVTVYILD
ncbi:MAG: peptidoglycan-binding protein [Acidaminococcales bacterium]|jgi:3D (Asp-Asp-Asp) domain-containing protein|nr:peptidoglycan-binding protein [Acidaminococcales bacterium]